MNLFKTNKYGIMDLVETKHYYMVKVGKMWVRDKFVGHGDGELTQDFRNAVTYTEVNHDFFPPPLHTLQKAFKAADRFGGKVVRLTVTIEEVEESQ